MRLLRIIRFILVFPFPFRRKTVGIFHENLRNYSSYFLGKLGKIGWIVIPFYRPISVSSGQDRCTCIIILRINNYGSFPLWIIARILKILISPFNFSFSFFKCTNIKYIYIYVKRWDFNSLYDRLTIPSSNTHFRISIIIVISIVGGVYIQSWFNMNQKFIHAKSWHTVDEGRVDID